MNVGQRYLACLNDIISLKIHQEYVFFPISQRSFGTIPHFKEVWIQTWPVETDFVQNKVNSQKCNRSNPDEWLKSYIATKHQLLSCHWSLTWAFLMGCIMLFSKGNKLLPGEQHSRLQTSFSVISWEKGENCSPTLPRAAFWNDNTEPGLGGW